VPWDWSRIPPAGAPKTSVADPAAPTAFYAGNLTEAKGVGDCILAVAALARDGLRLWLRLAGPGDPTPWQALAKAHGIAEQITFLGMVPNTQVKAEMRAQDFVIVPSWHSYPEGLPNTIYEGLASQSVLVISDHPAFRGRLLPDAQALVFPAGDPRALAECLRRATRDAALYGRISVAAAAAHDSLYAGLEWQDLITAFLDDPENQSGWVAENALDRIPLP
jgi:glycosyltransferase involved in cell wall biosynthesis